MKRPSSFFSVHPGSRANQNAKATRGVADFLRTNGRMAALLPAVERLAELQRDCSALLPALFDACSVTHFEAGKLVLATPNAAIAAKLKQQLPKLQDGLLKRGWQVDAIRLKVQTRNVMDNIKPLKQLALPAQALSALAALKDTLEDEPRNAALKSALEAMLMRHRRST